MLAELIGGFVIVYVYYAFVIDKRTDHNQYSIMIGAVFLLLNMTFNLGMTVMVNPLRYLSGAIVNLTFENSYIFLLSSCFGAISSAYIFEKHFLKNQKIN